MNPTAVRRINAPAEVECEVSGVFSGLPQPVDADVEVATSTPGRGLKIDHTDPPAAIVEPRARSAHLFDPERPQHLARRSVEKLGMRELSRHGGLAAPLLNLDLQS
jgi:hypothetical protein